MIRHVPVAVAHRDGWGLPLEVVVAAEIRHPARILAPDGAVCGVVGTDGTTFWGAEAGRPRNARVAPERVVRALAGDGRLTAALDERGVVLALRVEPRRRRSGSL